MDREDLQANMKILINMTLDKIGEDDWVDGSIEDWINGSIELDSVLSEDNEQIIALEKKS